MTFGSLFAGIGGLDLGLERAGMTCRWQVEIDPYCLKVLAKHWPDVKRYEDIRKLTGDELEPVDLVCGGPPCQDLSQAGKRAGIEGTRSRLWFEFSRLVGELRPGWVLVENVPGLLVYDGMRRIIGELSRCGYVGFWRCLRASDFGAAHIRKRVFVVAHLEHTIDQRPRGGWTDGQKPLCGGYSKDVRYATACSGADVAHSEYQRRGIVRETHHANRDHASGDHVDGCDPDVAHGSSARSDRSEREGFRTDRPPLQPARSLQGDGTMADSGLAGNRWPTQPAGIDRRRPSSDNRGTSGTLDHTEFPRLEIGDRKREQPLRERTESIAPGLPAFAPGPSDPRWPAILAARPDLAPALANSGHAKRKTGGSGENAGTGTANGGYIARDGSRGEPASPDEPGAAPPQSEIRGMADGLSSDMDGAMSNRTKRLGRLGNAVVPQVAEWIGRRILESEDQ